MRLLSLLAVLSVLAHGSVAPKEKPILLHIRIPAGFDGNKATVLVGQYGNGLGLGEADGRAGPNEYTQRISEVTTYAKLLIYYPGCKIVTAQIPRAKMSQPFIAVFQKLPMLPLTIKLTRSNGTPLPGKSVSFISPSMDMPYFGYGDGMTFPGNTVPIQSRVTDSSGHLTVQVPLLLDDPLFAKLNVKPGFGMSIQRGVPQGLTGYQLNPRWIPSRKSYPDPIAVKLVYNGKISGRVYRSFLARNGVNAPMGPSRNKRWYRVWFWPQNISRRGAMGKGVAADGTFSMPVEAGTYDLRIDIRSKTGKFQKTIPLKKGFVVGENEDRRLEFK